LPVMVKCGSRVASITIENFLRSWDQTVCNTLRNLR
jgi:hypothetical protein